MTPKPDINCRCFKIYLMSSYVQSIYSLYPLEISQYMLSTESQNVVILVYNICMQYVLYYYKPFLSASETEPSKYLKRLLLESTFQDL